MPDDLYSLWLKVAPGPRPPDHYALLGLPRFCDNQEQIESAAQKQLDELDRHSLHNDVPRREACHRMMNEVARARVALTNPQKRAAYDLTLDPGRIPPPVAPALAPLGHKPSINSDAGSEVLRRAGSNVEESGSSEYLRTGVGGDPLSPPIAEPNENQQELSDWRQRIITAGRDNPVIWLVPIACIAVIVGALIVVHATRPAPPSPVAIVIPHPPKPAPASPATAPIPVHPVDVIPKPSPPTIPTTVVTGHEPTTVAVAVPPSPATAKTTVTEPPPAIAIGKPIPPADLQEKSNKLVDQIYGSELTAAQTPQARSDLARKMLASANALGNDDVGRFVLLKRCADLAIEALDLNTAVAAIDGAGHEFQIDSLKIKARALSVFANNVATNHDQQALEHQMNAAIDQAVMANRYDIAKYVSDVARAAAQTANDPLWVQRADARAKEVADAQAEFEKTSSASGRH